MSGMFRWRNNSHQEQEDDSSQQQIKIDELKAATGPQTGAVDSTAPMRASEGTWKLGIGIEKAKRMLEDSLKWRSTFKPEEIQWDQVAIEGETGKVYRANFHDGHGGTVLILRPVRQNTASLDNQMRHLVYLIENAILNLPEGQEQMSWLIDFTGWTLNTSVPIKSARETVNILQNHYPGRLAVAFLYNPPGIFEAFWKIVKHFLDTKTFHKVKFVYLKNKDSVELMRQYFDEENLPRDFGGKALLMYDYDEFSKRMAQDDASHPTNGYSGAEVAPEPASLAPPAS